MAYHILVLCRARVTYESISHSVGHIERLFIPVHSFKMESCIFIMYEETERLIIQYTLFFFFSYI